MRLPWRRRRPRAARSQAAHSPAKLSFRGRWRSNAVPRRREDAARGLSFRRRTKRRPASAPKLGAARGLSFRRRGAKRRELTPPRALARSLSFRRRRVARPADPERVPRKLTLRRRRPSPERPPRTQIDGTGLALRLVGLGLLAGMLQLLVVSQIAVLGVSADVTPLVVASAGFLCGSLAGAGFGFGLGLFVDLAFVQTLGISSLLFTLIGYGAGRLRELRAPSAPLTRLLLGGAATVTSLAGYGAIEFMLGVNTPVSTGLVGAILKTTVLNSLIAIPVYTLTRRLLLPALPHSERRPQGAPTPTGGLSPLSRA